MSSPSSATWLARSARARPEVHSSRTLTPADFAVERDGRRGAVEGLWAGYDAPRDRLAVLLDEPLDPVGCATLIVATTTLFYEHLRATRGPQGFFRYPDTFLVGIGGPPGEFRRLDVWPPHKLVTLAPSTPEALLEALTDRRVTLLAVPEDGVGCRGAVALSTWNTLRDTVRQVVAYAPRTGRARDADLTLVGNPVVEGYVEHAIASTPGLDAVTRQAVRRSRRALDREHLVPAEGLRVLPGVDAAAELLGVAEILPAGQVP